MAREVIEKYLDNFVVKLHIGNPQRTLCTPPVASFVCLEIVSIIFQLKIQNTK